MLSGEEEEEDMKVFLPNRSAARQRSLSRSSPSSCSAVESLCPPAFPGSGVPASWLSVSMPAVRCASCASGAFCKALSPRFGIAVTLVSVSSAGAQLLQKCDTAHLVLLLLKMALRGLFFS